jgi:hypothetical protein
MTSSGKAISPQQKRLKLKGENTVEVENNQNKDKTAQTDNKPVHLQLPGNLEIHDTLAVSGIRPVTSSDLQVVETKNIMGMRPITANTFDVVDTMNLSGIRPIGSSALVVSETYSVMGNRPVASNVIDDSESLMGFLD